MNERVKWPDERIDDLARKVRENSSVITPLSTDVAVMKTEMRTLTRAMEENTRATRELSAKHEEATEELAQQLEDAKREPLERKRDTWTRVGIAVGAAVVGGLFVALAAVLSSVH